MFTFPLFLHLNPHPMIFFRSCPVLLLFFVLAGCQQPAGPDLLQHLQQHQQLVVSHRAVPSPLIAENSLQGMRKAHEAGIAMHEIDLRMSADGQLVVIHDPTLERTTSASGPVSSYTLDQLQDVMLRDSGERLPVFGDFLAYASQHGLYLMLDLKGSPLDKVMQQVQEYGMTGQVLLLTFSRETALEAFALEQPVMVSVLVGNMEDYEWYDTKAPDPQRWLAYLNQGAPEALFAEVATRGRKIVSDTMGSIDRQAAEEGLQVYRQFVNSRKISIIVSDYPLELQKALQ